MSTYTSRFFFDRNDHALLRIVNDVLDRSPQGQSASSLLASYMHPHGIKEMAAPQVLRIAYAIASLLGSLEEGQAVKRLRALRALKNEVILSATSYLQKNTSRVLLQIMKELIRNRGNQAVQLCLAHDFRMASSGKPRIVRAELEKYHLLEMPEEWNQLAFDDHIHDANTKGRKSPTHLVMDAWIKGIRFLTVVYYNYVDPEVADELLEAGSILDMRIRIGIEVLSRFRGKYVRTIWEPRGYTDPKSFRAFLEEQPVRAFMHESRQVSTYQQKYVFEALHAYNAIHRLSLNQEFGLDLDELSKFEFKSFVGTGQPSLLHLAKFIQSGLGPKLEQAVQRLGKEYRKASPERRKELESQVQALNAIDSEMIITRYLQPCRNPDLHDPSTPQDSPDVPALLQLTPGELLPRLAKFHSSSHFTLSLANLSIPDTLEILYDCQGHITNIELYSLKDISRGRLPVRGTLTQLCPGDAVDLTSPERLAGSICALRDALNQDNVIALKKAIREVIWSFEEDRLSLAKQLQKNQEQEDLSMTLPLEQELSDMEERKAKLLDILFNIETFHKFYKNRSLGSRLGSSSTGQSRHQYGMGVVVLDTLPRRSRKLALAPTESHRKLLPVTACLTVQKKIFCQNRKSKSFFLKALRAVPGLEHWGCQTTCEWSLENIDIHPDQPGNVITLGGIQGYPDNGLRLPGQNEPEDKTARSSRRLSTAFKNALKILIGFIPAFLTFALTESWWVLAYLGAFIWYAITWVRNVIQSVLGGGGLKRSPLLRWNSLVSWSRIADDLLYTGLSVPLLELGVKTMLMDHTFGVNANNAPGVLFTVMALINGVYIYSHNIFRGLPRNVAIANFFRSILSIPLAVIFNFGLSSTMYMAEVPITTIEEMLQKWAAVVSKVASDCIAAIVEGLGDRQKNVRIRLADYRAKLVSMFDVYARLDVTFPEEDVLDMLQSPKTFMETITYEVRDLEKVLIANALDLMYLWFYQPRAQRALLIVVQNMTREEWLIFLRSQYVLLRHREISQMFVDGLVGKNFSKALAFYLDRSEEYLRNMEQIGQHFGTQKS